MATAVGTPFWVDCQGGCGKRTGSGWTVADGRHLCAKCAKAAKLKRTNAFADTDLEAQRKGLTEAAQVAKVVASEHKALFTEGGRLKGGNPEKVSKAVAAKLGKGTPKVAAPAKAAPKPRGRKRPAAKTA